MHRWHRIWCQKAANKHHFQNLFFFFPLVRRMTEALRIYFNIVSSLCRFECHCRRLRSHLKVRWEDHWCTQIHKLKTPLKTDSEEALSLAWRERGMGRWGRGAVTVIPKALRSPFFPYIFLFSFKLTWNHLPSSPPAESSNMAALMDWLVASGRPYFWRECAKHIMTAHRMRCRPLVDWSRLL